MNEDSSTNNDMFACPRCRSSLETHSKDMLRCTRCYHEYPVVQKIPRLLPYRPEDAAPTEYDILSQGDGDEHTKASYRFAGQQRAMASAFKQIMTAFAPTSGSILDVGCGRGFFSKDFVGTHSVAGLDLSADLLVTAHKRGIVAVQGDAMAIPFPDHAFDIVLCPEFVQMFDDPEPIVRELARVCRTGGIIILSTLYARSIFRRVYRLRRFLSHQARDRQKTAILRNDKDLAALIDDSSLALEKTAWTHFPTARMIARKAGVAHPAPALASNIILILRRL